MTCSGCNQPLEAGARFCGYCGRFAGHTLRDIARDEAPLPIERVVELVRAIAAAVGEASHVAHIDLRPELVYIDAGGTAKLADALAPPQLAYASPEQRMGRGGDERSLVYVLGVIAYELAVGRVPGHARPVAPPSTLRGDLPRAFDRFVVSLLHEDPALRPDIPAVLTALEML